MTHLMLCSTVVLERASGVCMLNPFLESFPWVGDQLRLLKFPFSLSLLHTTPTFRRSSMYVCARQKVLEIKPNYCTCQTAIALARNKGKVEFE